MGQSFWGRLGATLGNIGATLGASLGHPFQLGEVPSQLCALYCSWCRCLNDAHHRFCNLDVSLLVQFGVALPCSRVECGRPEFRLVSSNDNYWLRLVLELPIAIRRTGTVNRVRLNFGIAEILVRNVCHAREYEASLGSRELLQATSSACVFGVLSAMSGLWLSEVRFLLVAVVLEF